MGSKDKFFGIISSDHGFDDIGSNQPTGTISGMTSATQQGPLFLGKLMITITPTAQFAALKKGQPIVIAGAYQPTGPTRILKKVGENKLVVNLAYNAGSAGTGNSYSTDGGGGAWDAFQVMGADILGATNIAMTFHNPNEQGGDETKTDYQEGKVYVFPGTIKTIQLGSAGNLRLIRSATLRPGGATGSNSIATPASA